MTDADPIENRCKLYVVEDREILLVISEFACQLRRILEETGDEAADYHIRVPQVSGVPAGAAVRAVHSDYACRSFLFQVHHESFDEVPPGRIIPRETSSLEFGVFHVCVKNGNLEVLKERDPGHVQAWCKVVHNGADRSDQAD